MARREGINMYTVTVSPWGFIAIGFFLGLLFCAGLVFVLAARWNKKQE